MKQRTKTIPEIPALPRVIDAGRWANGHVQGIAVDEKGGFIYLSFTTVFLKLDLSGKLIGTVEGLTGHLGCISFNKEDGRVYGSIEYKHDSIGQGIMAKTGVKLAEEDAFYCAIFDVDAIDRVGMDAERDGVMTAVYLRDPSEDYAAMGKEGRAHRYACSGIDGTGFGPKFGASKDSPYMLYIAYGIYGDTDRDDNDNQVILEFDPRKLGEYAKPLTQGEPHHSGCYADAKYFLYTGNTTWGVQNLEYDAYTDAYLLAVYKGKKPKYQNPPMFLVDQTVKPRGGVVRGIGERGQKLTLKPVGSLDEKNGIYGCSMPKGATGIYSFGNGYYYFSHEGSVTENGQRLNTCKVCLYRYDPESGDRLFTRVYPEAYSANACITVLLDHAEKQELVAAEDRVYAANLLLDTLGLAEYAPEHAEIPLSRALSCLCDIAVNRALIGDTVAERDLFDTRLMAALCPRPSELIKRFEEDYKVSPKLATDNFYRYSVESNYIRADRIARDVRWQSGRYELSINLSKPEKDPRAIAAAKLLPQSGYPACALCRENVGFAGDMRRDARQTLRQIPIPLAGETWYLQYSPYVYYNEHCILLSPEHRPMKIDRHTFERQLEFVTYLPHYFIGSNADLPIVGGSILSHDHMQGGSYELPMARAEVAERVVFKKYPEIEAGILDWPMSVIRLRGRDKARMVDLCTEILEAWRGYTSAAQGIYAETNGEKHNTITPIARRRGEDYEVDLVLRNNRTSRRHPLGIFHPHAEHHNIKKENIGLIEVMGLAVLPARLKNEMNRLATLILSGRDIEHDAVCAKHYEWYMRFKESYEFTPENTVEILRTEMGKTFDGVLRDAGVFKQTESGLRALKRFVSSVK